MTFLYDISNLSLNDENLTDPLLMALAWKKAHSYIRTTNWYADNFELDKSSLLLSEKCVQWAGQDHEEPLYDGAWRTTCFLK